MRSIILLGVALMVITLAVYWQVGDHEFVGYDDGVYITENPHVSTGLNGPNIIWAFSATYASNWHPITWLSHMADAQMYGMNPRGHHLTNVFIHSASTLLLLLLLFRLTGSVWPSSFVAAMFALHPLHVESVAWAAERKDLLCAFFWFLTLHFYATYVTKRVPTAYLFCLLAFILGLMSKPMLVTLPIVMLLLDFWPFNRFSSDGEDGQRHVLVCFISRLTPLLTEKIPFFACSLFSAAVTIYAQQKGGAIRTLAVTPLWSRIENTFVAYVKYIYKTLWPHDLAVFYPYASAIPVWEAICSLLILLIISLTTIWFRRRHPYLLVGWFWFIVTLVPVIGLIQVGDQSMADRYTYIPLIGLFMMAAFLSTALAKGLSQFQQRISVVVVGVLLIVSAALTWQQIAYWQDSVSLFSHAARVIPRNYLAHFNLASIHAKKGALDDAIREYQEALAISPHDVKAHTNLGSILAKKGGFGAAIREFQEVLAVEPNNVMACSNIGNALAEKGDIDKAIDAYREAISMDANYLGARYNLANVLASNGRLIEAIIEYEKALRIDPGNTEIRKNLAIALEQKKRKNGDNN